MTSISSYQTQSGRRYRVRYQDPTTSRWTDKRGFATKRDAQAWAALNDSSILKNEFVSAARSRALVRELGPEWLARKAAHAKPSTLRVLESAWRVHVEPRWGAIAVAKIEFTAVQTWIAQLSATGASPTTVKRVLGVLSGILDDAVRDRRVLSNACAGIKSPPKVQRERVYLSHKQLQRLADESGHYRTLVLVLGYCGLRWGEATALRVKDIDFERRRLNVVLNAVELDGTIQIGTPKTHTQRSVPFPELLQADLRRACRDKLPDAIVFTNPRGERIRRSRTDVASKSWFSGAVRRSKIPRVTPHDLRHTAASLAISAGANVKAVQRMLGHRSAAMTLDVYGGLFEDDLDAVAQALNQAAGRAHGVT